MEINSSAELVHYGVANNAWKEGNHNLGVE